MAHELDKKADGKAAMFYYGERPWHGLGTELDKPATAEEAIQAAGLNWEVDTKPVYVSRDNGFYEVGNKFETMRVDTQNHLGVVGSKYVPVQNREAFTFFDSIVGEGQAIYHTAGSLFGGKKIWILAKLPEQTIIANKDNIDNFLLLMNSHDGSTPVVARFTPIRVVCNNTLQASLGRETHSQVSIRHTIGASVKLEEAHRILGVARTYFEEIGIVYQDMQEFDLKASVLKKYFEKVIPDPEKGSNTRAENLRSRLTEIFETSPAIVKTKAEGNLWGAFNAVTEYVTHEYKVSNEDIEGKKFDMLFVRNDGGANYLKSKALNAALDLLKN